MYKIAFLSYDWNSEIVSKLSKGIQQFTMHHQDVAVHFFNGFGNYGSEVADEGALQIFNLPYLESYDGVVLQGGRVWTQKDRQIIVDRAKEAGIPAVSVNYPLERCIEVSSDNYEGFGLIVEHILKDHHVRKLAFVKGKSDSPEAHERERAFRDLCEKYEVRDATFFDGAWVEEAGKNAARQMLLEHKIPEAIVCSNDSTAYGAIKELIAHGIKVPEDVLVTGFDNLEKAAYAVPSITTADRAYDEIAYAALDTILTHLDTGIQTGNIMIPCHLVLRTSCGHEDGHQDVTEIRNKYLKSQNDLKYFFQIRDNLQYHLNRCTNLYEIASVIEEQSPYLLGENTYFVMNGLYLDQYENASSVRHYGNHMYLMGIYEEGKKCTPDERHVYASFNRKNVLPPDIMDTRHVLTVYPLRYDEVVIGYIVMTGFTNRLTASLISILLSNINSTIENKRRKFRMDALNKNLSDLYVTDQLTCLYNRFGMDKFAEPMYNRAMEEDSFMNIIFIDVDNLKTINDGYGHDAGDKAIVMTANAIHRTIIKTDAIGIRYGGDEFVIVGGGDLRKKLEEAVNAEIEVQKPAFPYSISIGQQTVYSYDQLTLQEAIDHADDSMYSTKKKKKRDMNVNQ